MGRRLSTTLLAVPCVVISRAAHADPQMLGVIQTASSVPLHCTSDGCAAELTSICLHEQRPTPTTGYPYSPHNPDALQVTGVRHDGRVVDLGAAGILKFAAARGFTTVKVRVPGPVIAKLGLASLSVYVANPLTLVPEKSVHTDTPLSEADIELGAGPMRVTATGIVDHDTDTMHASQVLARMIDVLPKGDKASTDLRAGVWNSAAAPHAEKVSAVGRTRAKTSYNRCYGQTRIGDKTLRGCLAEAHDAFVRDLNVKYWEAVKAGS